MDSEKDRNKMATPRDDKRNLTGSVSRSAFCKNKFAELSPIIIGPGFGDKFAAVSHYVIPDYLAGFATRFLVNYMHPFFAVRLHSEFLAIYFDMASQNVPVSRNDTV